MGRASLPATNRAVTVRERFLNRRSGQQTRHVSEIHPQIAQMTADDALPEPCPLLPLPSGEAWGEGIAPSPRGRGSG